MRLKTVMGQTEHSLLDERWSCTCQDGLTLLQAIRLFGPSGLLLIVGVQEIVASPMKVIELVTSDAQLFPLRAAKLPCGGQFFAESSFCTFLLDNELRVPGSFRSSLPHVLNVVLLSSCLLVLALLNVHLYILGHLRHHGDDASASFALLVFAGECLRWRTWL